MPIDPHDTCRTVLRAAWTGDAAARSVFARSCAGPVSVYLADRSRRHAIRGEIDDEAFVDRREDV